MQYKQATDRPIPETIRYEISDTDRERAAPLMEAITLFFENHGGTPLEAYDDLIGQAPLEAHVGLEEVNDGGVKGWWCIPPDAPPGKVILYTHGGAYAMGSAKAFRGLGSRIAALTGISLFLVDYPLSGEAPFPAAPDTVLKAYNWLLEQGYNSIVLAGDSAGGGLTLVTLQQVAALPGTRQPLGAVVFSPWTDLALRGHSWNDPAITDTLILREGLQACANAYLGDADPQNPKASPLYGVMEHLPPLLIQVSTNEHLLDDSARFAAAAATAGVTVRLELWAGVHHVFQNDFTQLDCGKAALDEAAGFIRRLFDA